MKADKQVKLVLNGFVFAVSIGMSAISASALAEENKEAQPNSAQNIVCSKLENCISGNIMLLPMAFGGRINYELAMKYCDFNKSIVTDSYGAVMCVRK